MYFNFCSLLYSPKPDASSPRNEFHAIPPYTRAIYLVLAAALIKIFEAIAKNNELQRCGRGKSGEQQ
jgi:hypothetical protein